MQIINKEVDFEKYCKECKYKDLPGNEEPCDSCMEYPVRTYTTKPVKFEKDKKKK